VFSKRHLEAGQLVDAVRWSVQAFRQQHRPVVWVVSNYGEVEAIEGQTHTGKPCCIAGSWGARLADGLEPQAEDVLIKRWYSAFRETGLLKKLQGITELAICGVATNVCVQKTALEAQELGFKVEVLNDATAAGTFGKHQRALTELEKAGIHITSWSGILKEAGPVVLEGIGEGDSRLWCNTLAGCCDEGTFKTLEQEICWHEMFHRGGAVPRLVAIQGQKLPDGSEPLYRHPVDAQPLLCDFSPTVDRIRRAVEARVGHPLNHGLLQYYRTTQDWISEHSDKTLDVDQNSTIINVSFGLTRTMVLKPKGGGTQQRLPLPDGSFLSLGLATNRRWYHAIRQQGDGADGPRISLTFRYIHSFYNPTTKAVWGNGSSAKTQEEAERNAEARTKLPFKEQQAWERNQADTMVFLFREENINPDFDYSRYQPGFEVINLAILERT
jgi:nicotinamidase-related amidase